MLLRWLATVVVILTASSAVHASNVVLVPRVRPDPLQLGSQPNFPTPRYLWMYTEDPLRWRLGECANAYGRITYPYLPFHLQLRERPTWQPGRCDVAPMICLANCTYP